MQEDDTMSQQRNEMEVVRTTIVGGRPSGSGRDVGAIPRGVEVLLKKAAVDAEFRDRLFAERGSAAAAIELELDPAESAMLKAIPREQLENIVAQTVVPVEQRRVFLGRLAAPMLAVLGVAVAGCPAAKSTKPEDEAAAEAVSRGIRPDGPRTNRPPVKARPAIPPSTNSPPPTQGLRPDRP